MKEDPLYHLPPKTHTLIDIGCGPGDYLLRAQKKGVPVLIGIDRDKKILEQAKIKFDRNTNITFFHQSAEILPVKSSSCDVAICSHVLEHLSSEKRIRLIAEILRVLTPQGTFILTVPSNGLFSFLDSADFRLRFPGLFAIMSKIIRGREREQGVTLAEQEIDRHHHFPLKELQALLVPYFSIQSIRYGGCFISPICTWLEFPFWRYGQTNNFIFKTLQWINKIDLSINWGRLLGYQVLIILRPHKVRCHDTI